MIEAAPRARGRPPGCEPAAMQTQTHLTVQNNNNSNNAHGVVRRRADPHSVAVHVRGATLGASRRAAPAPPYASPHAVKRQHEH
ncbi:hypothetical protein GSI_02600 [Ganoderma sinense ZZ0214-1]|uniref:Uncharacterized protein n=1 Tax=Ganoderma sinense ZZ0214-1 TaxID=1077348 RepID=A0A2G8SM55_9APHY|nr:hypothetical protein GSI_02600 [Ganoderma sinense ZZ0214-1]